MHNFKTESNSPQPETKPQTQTQLPFRRSDQLCHPSSRWFLSQCIVLNQSLVRFLPHGKTCRKFCADTLLIFLCHCLSRQQTEIRSRPNNRSSQKDLVC